MPLGIRPTVDFAFKMLFGSPENSDLLIHLLNAVLQLESPIREAEILNPFNPKQSKSDKLSIVDVKARDTTGRQFIIEVQTTLPVGLKDRLVYYTCGSFFGQLREGQGYGDLCPTISICFLTQTLFPETSAGHLQFMLFDRPNEVLLTDKMQLHFVELPKYDIREAAIGQATKLDQWVFFLDQADEYEAESLVRLLPESAFHKATGVLEMISRTPDLRVLYDDEAKAELDHFSALKGAREEGEARGRAEGEARGRINLLKQLLQQPPISETDLSSLSLSQLQELARDLERQLSERG